MAKKTGIEKFIDDIFGTEKPKDKPTKLDNRRDIIESGKELQLAVEGRDTNLRIWKSSDGIYMRLDIYKQTSAPLNDKTVRMVDDTKSPIYKLAGLGFPTAKSNLDKILRLTANMRERKVKGW